MKIFRYFAFVLVIAILLSGCYIKRYEESALETRFDDNDLVFVLKSEADAIELLIDKTIDLSTILVPDDYLEIIKYIDGSTLIALAKASKIKKGEELLRIEGLSEMNLTSFMIWNIDDSYYQSNGTEPELLGDFTGDGQVEGFDFIPFAQSYGNAIGSPGYDAIYDMSSLENPASKSYAGVWAKIYSQKGTADGKIDGPDFIVFANNYGFANPYLGKWIFTGSIDYESGTYGSVKADGNGTLTIGQQNWQMSGPVELTANSTYTDEEGKEVSDTFEIEIASVDVQFSSTEMTVTGSIANPLNGVEYDVLMKGKLRVEGNAIYAESNGTGDGYGIFLLNPIRKIGEWTAHK